MGNAKKTSSSFWTTRARRCSEDKSCRRSRHVPRHDHPDGQSAGWLGRAVGSRRLAKELASKVDRGLLLAASARMKRRELVFLVLGPVAYDGERSSRARRATLHRYPIGGAVAGPAEAVRGGPGPSTRGLRTPETVCRYVLLLDVLPGRSKGGARQPYRSTAGETDCH